MSRILQNIIRRDTVEVHPVGNFSRRTPDDFYGFRSSDEPSEKIEAWTWAASGMDNTETAELVAWFDDVKYTGLFPWVGMGSAVPSRVVVERDSFRYTRRTANDHTASLRVVRVPSIDDGTYYFGFDGKIVASVDDDGKFRVLGAVTTGASLSGTYDAAIWISGEYLYISSGNSAPYTPRMRFDRFGNLSVAGSITQSSGLAWTTGNGQLFTATAAGFYVLPDRATGGFEYVVGTTTLHLRSTLLQNTNPDP